MKKTTLPSSSFILHPSSFILHPSSFILHPSSLLFAHFRQRDPDSGGFASADAFDLSRWQAADEAVAFAVFVQLKTAGAEPLELLAKLVPVERRFLFLAEANAE